MVNQQVFACQSVIQCVLPLKMDNGCNYRSFTKETSYLLKTHQHSYNLNFITQSYETLHNVHPSLLQNNTYQKQACSIHSCLTKTHRASAEFYLLVTQASFLPAEAVSSCHSVLTGYLHWGHCLLTAEKCPTLICGLWKEPTSWVNSMKGYRAEGPVWVFN